LVSVHVDLDVHRPIPLPDWVKDVFASFDSQAGSAPIELIAG
jgi:hypothetical protein